MKIYSNPYLVMMINRETKQTEQPKPKAVDKQIRKIDKLRYLNLVRSRKVDIYA